MSAAIKILKTDNEIVLKTATCVTEVPAVLSNTGYAIKVGATVEYKREAEREFVTSLILPDSTYVPASYFAV